MEGFITAVERVFCSLRDYPLLNHFSSLFLCIWVFLYVCSKIKLFDDDFLCSLFLSDFSVFRVFYLLYFM